MFAARLLVQRMLLHRDETQQQAQIRKISTEPEPAVVARDRKAGKGGKACRDDDDDQPEPRKGQSEIYPEWSVEPRFKDAELRIVKTTAAAVNREVGAGVKIGQKRVITLGREKEAVDILALHPSVSRRHAMFAHDVEGNIFVSAFCPFSIVFSLVLFSVLPFLRPPEN